MGDEKTPLEYLKDLKLYIGIELPSMDNPLDRLTVEGILERTVRALENEATPKEIKEVFGEHISAWHPDRTYG